MARRNAEESERHRCAPNQHKDDQTQEHNKPSTSKPRRPRLQLVSKAAIKRLTLLAGLAVVGLFAAWSTLVRMPGDNHTGPLPPLTETQRLAAARLERDVRTLATEHAHRHAYNEAHTRAAVAWLARRLADTGLEINITEHRFGDDHIPCINLDATAPAASPLTASPLATSPIVVVGAHHDSFCLTPGADDNASGVAGVLELAARFARNPAAVPVRFELYGHEEPPHFMTERMGSALAANAARARGDHIAAMINLEMIGYFDDTPGSQTYPPPIGPFYPNTADFIAIVGNVRSAGLVRRAVRTWRDTADFPVKGAALPESVPGIGFSDHRSFWNAGYRAIMVTDTAMYRNPNYHTNRDTPDTLDYDRMARVVDAVETIVRTEAHRAAARSH